MVIPDKSLLYQFVNFLLMWGLLNVWLIKPIRNIIQKRKELVAEQTGKIDKFSADAETKIKDYEAALTVARKQGNEVRAEFKDQGTAVEQGLMSAAGAEASKTLSEARVALDGETKAAMNDLKKGVDGFAAKAAAKVLGQ